jgi:hypothetical protein
MDSKHFIIDWMSWVLFIIFILLFFGILKKEPVYFVNAIFIFKLFIAFYLIYRFNDFRKKLKFTELDRKVCFQAGIYLLLFAFADLIQDYSAKIREYLKPYLPWMNKQIGLGI